MQTTGLLVVVSTIKAFLAVMAPMTLARLVSLLCQRELLASSADRLIGAGFDYGGIGRSRHATGLADSAARRRLFWWPLGGL